MRKEIWQRFSPYCSIVCGFIIFIVNLKFIYLMISEDNLSFLCFVTQKNSLHQWLPDSSEWASHLQSHLLPCPLHSQQLCKSGRWKKGEVCTINHLAAVLFAVLCHSLPLCYYLGFRRESDSSAGASVLPILGCRGRQCMAQAPSFAVPGSSFHPLLCAEDPVCLSMEGLRE